MNVPNEVIEKCYLCGVDTLEVEWCRPYITRDEEVPVAIICGMCSDKKKSEEHEAKVSPA